MQPQFIPEDFDAFFWHGKTVSAIQDKVQHKVYSSLPYQMSHCLFVCLFFVFICKAWNIKASTWSWGSWKGEPLLVHQQNLFAYGSLNLFFLTYYFKITKAQWKWCWNDSVAPEVDYLYFLLTILIIKGLFSDRSLLYIHELTHGVIWNCRILPKNLMKPPSIGIWNRCWHQKMSRSKNYEVVCASMFKCISQTLY